MKQSTACDYGRILPHGTMSRSDVQVIKLKAMFARSMLSLQHLFAARLVRVPPRLQSWRFSAPQSMKSLDVVNFVTQKFSKQFRLRRQTTRRRPLVLIDILYF